MKKRIQKKKLKKAENHCKEVPNRDAYKDSFIKSLKPLKPKRKEGLILDKSEIIHTKDYYVKDSNTNKVFKIHISSNQLQKELERLGINSEAIVSKGSNLFFKYKSLYKAQNMPSIRKTVKKIILKATEAITPHKVFKKGIEKTYSYTEKVPIIENHKIVGYEDELFEDVSWRLIPKQYRDQVKREKVGWVHSVKGTKQEESRWEEVQFTDSTGLVRTKRVPAKLVITDISTMDYTVNPKDEDGNRVSRLTTYIKPPESKGTREEKQKLAQEKQLKSFAKIRETRERLRIKRRLKNKSNKKRNFVDTKYLSQKVITPKVFKPKSDYLKTRQEKIRQNWEERELKLINYLKKRVNKLYTNYADYIKVRDNWKYLRSYYSDKKREAYMAKMEEIKKQQENGKK